MRPTWRTWVCRKARPMQVADRYQHMYNALRKAQSMWACAAGLFLLGHVKSKEGFAKPCTVCSGLCVQNKFCLPDLSFQLDHDPARGPKNCVGARVGCAGGVEYNHS